MSVTTLMHPVQVEIPRDRWGRPLVTPPDGGKPVPYTRCTTYVGALEDTYNLGQWQMRMTAVGLAARPDLLLRASSLGGVPDDDDPGLKRWKEEMNSVVDAAKEAAAASASATIGTALHLLTERIDRGLPLGTIPAAYEPHLAAYRAATAAFEAVHIERFTVEDELRIGGTPDRVLRIGGGLYIGDLKTGSVDFGIGKMCMQLSVYAHSMLYDFETSAREPLGPDVALDRGLIVALSAKTGSCRLIWIDLAAGWKAVQIATQVRAWRARRDLVLAEDTERASDRVEQARDLTVEAEAALRAAIAVAPAPEALVDLWRKAGSVWTDEHSLMASQRKAELLAGRELGASLVDEGR